METYVVLNVVFFVHIKKDIEKTMLIFAICFAIYFAIIFASKTYKVFKINNLKNHVFIKFDKNWFFVMRILLAKKE